MRLRVDLHVHTVHSGDSCLRFKDIVREAKNADLDGIAITDHDTIEAYVRCTDADGLLVIPAVEVSSLNGHILAYGVTENVNHSRSPAETIDEIHAADGVAIAAHIMRRSTTTVPSGIIGTLSFDGLETVNASTLSPFVKDRAKTFASRLCVPQTGGTDAHVPGLIGRAFTVVEVEEKTVDSILRALKQGKVEPVGGPTYTLQRIRKIALLAKKRMGFRVPLPSGLG